MDLVTQPCPL